MGHGDHILYNKIVSVPKLHVVRVYRNYNLNGGVLDIFTNLKVISFLMI